MSALRIGCLYHPGKIPDTHFCQALCRPQGHAAGSIVNDANDTIGNRTRDLPACSTVPQPMRHRVPTHTGEETNKNVCKLINYVIKPFRNLYPHNLSANRQYNLADTHPAYFRFEYNTVDWRHAADYRLAVSPHDQQQTDNFCSFCVCSFLSISLSFQRERQ